MAVGATQLLKIDLEQFAQQEAELQKQIDELDDQILQLNQNKDKVLTLVEGNKLQREYAQGLYDRLQASTEAARAAQSKKVKTEAEPPNE